MSERYCVEYNSNQGFVIVDVNDNSELCCAGKDMAERVAEALNVAVARGVMRTSLASNTSGASGCNRFESKLETPDND